MGDIFDKVTGSRSLLEKLTGMIPGWKGYQERQERRKADQLMRQMLADKMADQRKRLDVAQTELINNGKLELVDDIGRAVTQLQTFIDRVRFASYGYSGLFDAVKVNKTELEQMYNFDAALFDYVERLNTANDRLREAISTDQGLIDVIHIIQDICREANSTFDQREHIIVGEHDAGRPSN